MLTQNNYPLFCVGLSGTQFGGGILGARVIFEMGGVPNQNSANVSKYALIKANFGLLSFSGSQFHLDSFITKVNAIRFSKKITLFLAGSVLLAHSFKSKELRETENNQVSGQLCRRRDTKEKLQKFKTVL